MNLEARIKRLERERDHPGHPWQDPETVAHWASLWTAAGLEESRLRPWPWSFYYIARHSDRCQCSTPW